MANIVCTTFARWISGVYEISDVNCMSRAEGISRACCAIVSGRILSLLSRDADQIDAALGGKSTRARVVAAQQSIELLRSVAVWGNQSVCLLGSATYCIFHDQFSRIRSTRDSRTPDLSFVGLSLRRWLMGANTALKVAQQRGVGPDRAFFFKVYSHP